MFHPDLNNTFALVVFFIFSYLAFAFIYDFLITDVLSIDRHVPASIYDVPTWQRLYDLPEAPVIEEFVSRLLMIGLPLYFIQRYGIAENGYKNLRSLFTGLFSKENRKYFFGGGFDIDTTTFFVLLISSGIFALLHLGWDWTKLPPTFLGGMMLGYLFLKKGMHASIILHFAVNSMNIVWLISGESDLYSYLLDLMYIGAILIGSIYFLEYLQHFRWMVSRLDLNVRGEVFQRSIIASGGTLMLVVSMGCVFLIAALVFSGSIEKQNDDHLLALSDNDYQVIELQDLRKGDSIEATISIQEEGGEVNLFLASDGLKDKWKEDPENVEKSEFSFHLHIPKAADTSDQNGSSRDWRSTSFDVTIDDDDEYFLIIEAGSNSTISLDLTTRKESKQPFTVLFNGGFFGVGAFVSAMVGIGCIYTSNSANIKLSRKTEPGFPESQSPSFSSMSNTLLDDAFSQPEDLQQVYYPQSDHPPQKYYPQPDHPPQKYYPQPDHPPQKYYPQPDHSPQKYYPPQNLPPYLPYPQQAPIPYSFRDASPRFSGKISVFAVAFIVLLFAILSIVPVFLSTDDPDQVDEMMLGNGSYVLLKLRFPGFDSQVEFSVDFLETNNEANLSFFVLDEDDRKDLTDLIHGNNSDIAGFLTELDPIYHENITGEGEYDLTVDVDGEVYLLIINDGGSDEITITTQSSSQLEIGVFIFISLVLLAIGILIVKAGLFIEE